MGLCSYNFIPVVRIGFQSARYNVSEASTIATVITIEASGGLLEREIIVTLSTNDSTATGSYLFSSLLHRSEMIFPYFSRRGLCGSQLPSDV